MNQTSGHQENGFLKIEISNLNFCWQKRPSKSSIKCFIVCDFSMFFFIIHLRRLPTLNDFWDYYIKYIFTIDVSSCVLFAIKGIVKSFCITFM